MALALLFAACKAPVPLRPKPWHTTTTTMRPSTTTTAPRPTTTTSSTASTTLPTTTTSSTATTTTTTTVPQGPRADDASAMGDLLFALSWENKRFIFDHHFDGSKTDAKAQQSYPDWDTLQLAVGDADNVGDGRVLCLSKTSASGTTFTLGRIEGGPHTGTFYGHAPCPVIPDATNVPAISDGWFDPLTSATGPPGVRLDDWNVEQQLLGAMDWQNTNYVVTGHFDADTADARAALPALDWDGTLQFDTGEVLLVGNDLVFCVSEVSPSGVRLSAAAVNGGPSAGLYFNRGGLCPPSAVDTVLAAAAWNTGW